MSIPRHHAEWLSLLDISGPFLSMPVLLRAFPQGLDTLDEGLLRRVRAAHAEWLADCQSDPGIHTRWVEFVLREVLGFADTMRATGQAIPPTLSLTLPEHGETLRPDAAILKADDATRARLLIQIYPPEQALERSLPTTRWAAKPAARMMELLRTTNVRLGLVTNGEQFLLVDAPRGQTAATAAWYAQLWLDEPVTLRAFTSLISAKRFFGMSADDAPEALLAESAIHQQEVTDRLGEQVRHAVELLIGAMDSANRNGAVLRGVSEAELYEATLTVMMRLVILFCAEERGLLLLGDPLFDQNYAISTLAAQLREAADQHGEEVMEHRFDAWGRLCATFRLVHGGAQHDRLSLPAYGSSLFDPARYLFLEQPSLSISNRVTLHVLESLQFLTTRIPGGGFAERRRLSFRALDIEQIGHVYEGLLDHTATCATEPMLGLIGTKDKEPEVRLGQLEAMRRDGDDEQAALIEFLAEQTGRSENALRKALAGVDNLKSAIQNPKLAAACQNDSTLLARIAPFAGLIRNDDFEQPCVILPGSVFVTQAATRRSTGTHYTPRSLTEPIVQHTLEPLVYIGPAEGAPREHWRLRSPADLLRLKICDMAMGSGAFLVQSCRYLSERLCEAWAEIENEELRIEKGTHTNVSSFSILNSQFRITPEGERSSGKPGEQLIPQDPEERLAFARRIVADRCLYGVDKNPMAVEMAKLSLWLITLDKGRPFTFLDHALKCGDSLVGASESDFVNWARTLAGTPNASVMSLFDDELRGHLAEARAKRRELQAFEVREVADAERKATLLQQADAALQRIKQGCDVLVGTRLLGLKPKAAEARLAQAMLTFMDERQPFTSAMQAAVDAARAARAFHWAFEFPEVFGEGAGFTAFVGNPPFIGGQKISGQFGKHYLDFLNATWSHTRGSADLCAYFFLRAFDLLHSGGGFGLIATNTIAQGDTRERGLDYLAARGATIYNATNNLPWPGAAAVVVNVVHVHKGAYAGQAVLDGGPVQAITPLLDSREGSALGNPKRLAANAGKSFIGSYVLGMGFVLEPEQAQALIEKDPRNKDVLFPYLNGEDLNSRPDQSPSRWVINFFDWDLEKAQSYPDCFEIVDRLVKPERTRLNDKGVFALRKPLPQKWWIYSEKRPALYATIAPMKRVLVKAQTSKTWAFVFIEAGKVFDQKLVILATDESSQYVIFQSSIHLTWAQKFAGSLKMDMSYNPTDCFETFPLSPISNIQSLSALGERYHEHRRQTMLTRNEGLTKTYNRFHAAEETSADIAQLRSLHVEMDHAVAAAYGWTDLALGHGFHQTAQGARFTISETARRAVLGRLLALNHERFEYEAEQRLANEAEREKPKKIKRGKAANAGQGSLL